MPRITKESIERVKNTAKLSQVFSWLGVRMQESRHMAWCPMCADKDSRHPGMSFDDESGLWHCFVHGGGGDVISFVQEAYDLSFTEAVEKIAEHFNIPLEYDKSSDAGGDSSQNAAYAAALKKAEEIFVGQRVSPEFERFKEERHLDDDTVERYGIGMSDYRWSKAALGRLMETFAPDVLVGSGLCVRHDDGNISLRYVNRAMFPIRNVSGTIIGFGGRDVTGSASAKYINSPETSLFKKRTVLYGYDMAKRAISRERSVIVCEGYMDTIALQTHGFKNSVGAMGTALTTGNISYLSHYVDTIYVSLDADAAGRDAAMRVADNMPSSGSANMLVVMVPRDVAKDPDEFFNVSGQTTADYQTLLDSAVPLMTFCVMRLVESQTEAISEALLAIQNGASPESEAGIINKSRADAVSLVGRFMASHFSKIESDEVHDIAAWLVDSIKSSESPDSLMTSWRTSGSHASDDGNDRQATLTISTSESTDEDSLIGALYMTPGLRQQLKESDVDVGKLFTSDIRRSVFEKLMEQLSIGKDPKDVSSVLTQEENNELSRIVLRTKSDDSFVSSDAVQRLIDKVHADAVRGEIAQIEESAMPDFMRLISLRQKLVELSH